MEKRHIAVDTLGMILSLAVHSAGIQDRVGSKLVFIRLLNKFSDLKLIWVDGGYSGKLVDWVKAFCS